MREFQKCQRCGKIFTRIERTGPSVGGIGEIIRHSDEGRCPKCGGSVIWVDERDSPMSPSKRMEKMNRHLRLAYFWGIVTIIVFIIFFYFVVK